MPCETRPPIPDEALWVDASTSHIGILLQTTEDHCWSKPLESPQTQIYLAELAAALYGAQVTANRHVLVSDNQAAARAMLKGHASTRAGNAILRAWIHSTTATHVAWAPTDKQRADYLTRPDQDIAKTARWFPNPETIRWRKREGGLPMKTTRFSSKSAPTPPPTIAQCVSLCEASFSEYPV